MKRLALVTELFMIFAVAFIICLGSAHGANLPSLNVRLRLVDQEDNPTKQDVYRLDKDVVRFAIYQQNVGDIDIIASQKYIRKDFHLNLHLYVTGADGREKLITANYPEGAAEPPPPTVKLIDNQLVSVEPVEILPTGWIWMVAFNGSDYYDLVAGSYSAKVVIPVTTYNDKSLLSIKNKPYARLDGASKYVNTYDPIESIHPVTFSVIADNDGDGWYFPAPNEEIAADCNDTNKSVNPGMKNEIIGNGLDDDCNDATPDKPLIQNKTLIVHPILYKVGTGNRPPAKKKPYPGIEVRVFEYAKNSCCKQNFGSTWHFYESIWKSSELSECCTMQIGETTGYKKQGEPGKHGVIAFSLPPGNYLILGKPKNENVYTGARAVVLESDKIVERYLPYIVNADGKKCPGKYTLISGSELLIIEPEFVEWDGTRQYYPVIFDARGKWAVTTFLKPSRGFVADNDSLSEKISSEIKALQFTLTERDAIWKASELEHVIRQKGKTEKVTSKIDIKLSPKLAKNKGLSIWGHEDDPWKMKKKKKDK